uniref:Enkurin domain-containing protein n=1 Tax=Glossina brevipalpis TaxID=37001 RepID=A0A1A9W1Y7_9MUSC
MAIRATASNNNLRTLNGLFDLPKMNHRRDFLRENRLNLKELQRNTTDKITQNKLEQERKSQQYTPKNQRPQEQYVNRRSNSQLKIAVEGNDNMRGRISREPQRQSNKRSCSLHRAPNNNDLPKESIYVHDNDKCCLNPASSVKCPLNIGAISAAYKNDSCDKEIQTEDIFDEEFLYEALRKCSSIDLKGNNNKSQAMSSSNYEANQQRIYETDKLSQFDYNNCINDQADNDDAKSQHNFMQQEYKSQNNFANADTKSLVSYQQEIRPQQNFQNLDNISQHMLRSRASSNLSHNGYIRGPSTPPPTAQYSDEDFDDKPQSQSRYIDQNTAAEQEGLSSARSRQTVCSQLSKKSSTGSIQKYRDNVRLPRYLEKEKRDKANERLKELSRDISCPDGHYALSEEERIRALNNAKKKTSTLVAELNHMPITTETLRIRNRKREIETELTKIEHDIRLFSKPKVYIPLPANHS